MICMFVFLLACLLKGKVIVLLNGRILNGNCNAIMYNVYDEYRSEEWLLITEMKKKS